MVVRWLLIQRVVVQAVIFLLFSSCVVDNAQMQATLEDARSPAANDTVTVSLPTGITSSPASPSNSDFRPELTGTADANIVTINFYSDSACSSLIGTGTKAQFEGAGITVDLLVNTSNSIYIQAIDSESNTSVCSLAITYLHDSISPTDNTASLKFTDIADADGNDVAVTWTAFSDSNLSDYKVITYTDSACSAGENDHGFFASTSTSNSTDIDGLTNGTYYAKVVAKDSAGNETSSACSTDSILVDSIAPVDNQADLQFTNLFDTDGNNIAVTWTAFSDSNLNNHSLQTYTNSSCTTGEVDHGATGSSANSSSIIGGLADGTYHATVTASDSAGNRTTSACSTDTIIVDSTPPVDNVANLQFTNTTDTDGNDIAVTWTAFTDSNLSDYKVITFSNSSCTAFIASHGYFGSTAVSNTTDIDGVSDGTIYARVVAKDSAGNETTSACSTDSIIIDTAVPIDNGANLQFTNDSDNDGNDIAVTWTAFTDANLSDYKVITYTNSACSSGATTHGYFGSNAASNSTGIDGLDDGVYYAKVVAKDSAGNETTSACSSDSIIIDKTAPVDAGANIQFTNSFDNDGNDIAITWTAFTDSNLSNHRITTYTDSSCTTGITSHGATGSTANSNSTNIDGLADGTYYATVDAIDIAGNMTTSACSSDFIIVDIRAPNDNGTNLQFTNDVDTDGNDIAVTWTAFSDANLADHKVITYTDSACTEGAVTHGYFGSTAAANTTGIDGVVDGVIYAKVVAKDSAGNETISACSTDSIIVDTAVPVDNGANLQFTNLYDTDGNDIAVSWTAFSDANLRDYKIITYTSSDCSTGGSDHGYFGSIATSNTTGIDGLSDGVYYAKVVAKDVVGNETTSACSTDSITVDTMAPAVQITSIANNAFINAASNSATYAISGTCSGSDQNVQIEVDSVGVTESSQVACNGTNWSLTISTTALSEAAHTFVAVLSDAAGNTRNSDIVNFTKDITAPAAPSSLATSESSSTSTSTSPTFTWTSNSEVDFAQYDVSVGTSAGATDISSEISNSTNLYKKYTGQSYSSATYYFNVKARDNAGNQSSASTVSWDVIAVAASAPSFLNFAEDDGTNNFGETTDATPKIRGIAGANSTSINIYADSACANFLATGTVSDFEANGANFELRIGALDYTNDKIHVYAKGSNAVGDSACTYMGELLHYSGTVDLTANITAYWNFDDDGVGSSIDGVDPRGAVAPEYFSGGDDLGGSTPVRADGVSNQSAQVITCAVIFPACSKLQYWSVPDSADIQLGATDNLTVSFWFKTSTTETTNSGYIFGKGGVTLGTFPPRFTNPISYGVWYENTTRKLQFDVGFTGVAGTATSVIHDRLLLPDTWHHVTIWRDFTNRKIGIAIDNFYKKEESYSATPTTNSNTLKFFNMFLPVNDTNYSYFDNVGIWKRVLNAKERENLYTSPAVDP